MFVFVCMCMGAKGVKKERLNKPPSGRDASKSIIRINWGLWRIFMKEKYIPSSGWEGNSGSLYSLWAPIISSVADWGSSGSYRRNLATGRGGTSGDEYHAEETGDFGAAAGAWAAGVAVGVAAGVAAGGAAAAAAAAAAVAFLSESICWQYDSL